MSDMKNFLRDKMRSFGAGTYKKFLGNELIHDWDKLVDESIAAQVRPVTLEHGILFVHVKNSAFKDQLKFFAEEIIDALNEHFAEDEPLVKEIRIAYGFQVADLPPEKIPPAAQKKSPVVKPEDVTLTDEELARCNERAQKFSDEKLRETVLQTLISQAKAQKFRLINNWHKCKRCDALCAPEEIFCESCKIKVRDEMISELFKIFYDTPQIKPWDAQKILLERMPFMRRECSLDAVESARTSLIQKIAGRIRIGDETSPDVLKLVALARRLPLEQITPAIIQRTLVDLQFNLADQTRLRRYNAIKSPKK